MEIIGLSRRAEVFLGFHPLFMRVADAKIWWNGRTEIFKAKDVFENTIVDESEYGTFEENGCTFYLDKYVLADGRVVLEAAVRCIAPDGNEVIAILLRDAAAERIIPESVSEGYRIAEHAGAAA